MDTNTDITQQHANSFIKKKKLYEKHCIKKAPFVSMKTLCENSFSRFAVFGNIRKNESKKKKKIFDQHKKYDLFLEIVFH